MSEQLPVPAALQARWQSLTIFMDLILGQSAIDMTRLEVRPDSTRHGVWNDGDGSYGWLACSSTGALFYGASDDDPDKWEIGPGMEKKARKKIATLSDEIQSLVSPMIPESLGWTFAFWSPSPHDSWQDLTDRDPGCWETAQFPECEALYGGIEDVQEWVVEQLGGEDIEREIEQIVRFEPLTKAMATALMGKKVDLDLARASAIRTGYPLESDWA